MYEINTPGVSVKEIPRLPPSMVEVETAVPFFIGYTEKAIDNDGSVLHLKPKKISSLIEYENCFGGAKQENIHLKDVQSNQLEVQKPVTFLMYYSLQMYFANGGGPCYIVSTGEYTDVISYSQLKSGLDTWALKDESTLVVFPDATLLPNQSEFYTLYKEAISLANSLKNRFVILDTYLGDSTTLTDISGTPVNTIEQLRREIQPNVQAAAYFPHLKTVLNYAFSETALIDHERLPLNTDAQSILIQAVDTLTGLHQDAIAEQNLGEAGSIEEFSAILDEAISVVENVNVSLEGYDEIYFEEAQVYLQNINYGLLDVTEINIATIISDLIAKIEARQSINGPANGKTLQALKVSNSELYNKIKNATESLYVILPPSSIIAGVYSKVDNARGVWKAPANVSLNYVILPTEKISDEEQEVLNKDENGKSVNAIRNFTNRGTQVWGARTYKSTDEDFKYVPVRRLFNMIEKSLKNSTHKFLDEPNEANTWVRVKAMIENYLNQLWLNDAMEGNVATEAYYVKLDNDTTTQQDIDSGIMNIKIGIAAVRPAEFIVLNFSHKSYKL